MSSALAPTVNALPEGLARVELPTPFPVGPVNCYVLADHPVTVVDPGMGWAESVGLLEAALAAAGLRPHDVEQIVVTHAHPDHFGTAGWLARASDAPIVCGRPETPKLADGWSDGGIGTKLAGLVDGLGLPDEVRRTFKTFHEAVTTWVEVIDHDQIAPVDDGSLLTAGGRSWQVHLTPGHAAGHISLFDAGSRTLLGGDHLLARITPNPLLEPDAASPLGRRRSLVEYLASLERFEALDPAVVLSGHGPAFTDLAQWAVAVRAHHARRADEVLDLVRRLGSASAFELSRQLFPHLEGFSHLLGISEVVGHLDLLLDGGEVLCDSGVPDRYVAL